MNENNLTGISKVSYQGINDIILLMEKIGIDNLEIGKNFENTINSFKNDKSLSSKVITPSMESMIDSINKLNIEFKENVDRYCEFLKNDVKEGYYKSDENIEDLWTSLKDMYENVKE